MNYVERLEKEGFSQDLTTRAFRWEKIDSKGSFVTFTSVTLEEGKDRILYFVINFHMGVKPFSIVKSRKFDTECDECEVSLDEFLKCVDIHTKKKDLPKGVRQYPIIERSKK